MEDEILNDQSENDSEEMEDTSESSENEDSEVEYYEEEEAESFENDFQEEESDEDDIDEGHSESEDDVVIEDDSPAKAGDDFEEPSEEELKAALEDGTLTLEEYQALSKGFVDWSEMNGLLGGLPEYLFMSPEKKKQHFKELNAKYFKELAEETDVHQISHIRRVLFSMKGNKVLEFDNEEKVTDLQVDKAINPQPAKKVLKKTLKFTCPSHETENPADVSKNDKPEENQIELTQEELKSNDLKSMNISFSLKKKVKKS